MGSHSVHSLNVPVLCFVFGLMMAEWAETCRRIFNCKYWLPTYAVFIDWLNYYIIGTEGAEQLSWGGLRDPGITYQARYVVRIRSWLTAGRNTHGSSTTKLPWNDHGCLLRTDLQTLMLEKPIMTRCQATTPASSSFYKYPSQWNGHT